MYYRSRTDVGIKLASKAYEKYRYEDCAVLCLNEASVLVGEQIAIDLHCAMMLLVTRNLEVPGENIDLGVLDQNGKLTYNNEFSKGEIEEFENEFHGYFEDKKRTLQSEINIAIGDGGVIDNRLLQNRHIFLVSDGILNTQKISAAINYLKPVETKKIIIASPFILDTIKDEVKMLVDDSIYLDIKSNPLDKDHYYENNMKLSHKEIIEKINKIILNWR
jgi:predicted phosphoribosyltransferase